MKTSKNTPSDKKPKATFFDEYYNLRQKDKLPMTNLGISALAEEYYDWAVEDDTAIAQSDFYLRKGIDQRTFHNWLGRSEELQRAHKVVMELIANRRERKGLDRTFDAGMVRYTMPRYSKAYRKLEEWRSSLREKKHDDGGTKIVIMEKFADVNE